MTTEEDEGDLSYDTYIPVDRVNIHKTLVLPDDPPSLEEHLRLIDSRQSQSDRDREAEVLAARVQEIIAEGDSSDDDMPRKKLESPGQPSASPRPTRSGVKKKAALSTGDLEAAQKDEVEKSPKDMSFKEKMVEITETAKEKLSRMTKFPEKSRSPSDTELIKLSSFDATMFRMIQQLYEQFGHLESTVTETLIETTQRLLKIEEKVNAVCGKIDQIEKVTALLEPISGNTELVKKMVSAAPMEELCQKLTATFRQWQDENKATVRNIEKTVGCLKAGVVAVIKDIGKEPPKALTEVPEVTMSDLHVQSPTERVVPLIQSAKSLDPSKIKLRLSKMRKFFGIEYVDWHNTIRPIYNALKDSNIENAQQQMDKLTEELEAKSKKKFDLPEE